MFSMNCIVVWYCISVFYWQVYVGGLQCMISETDISKKKAEKSTFCILIY